MTEELAVPVWLAVLMLLVLLALAVVLAALLISVRRSRRRTERLLSSAAEDAEALRSQLATIESRLSGADPGRDAVPAGLDDPEYLITELGAAEAAPTVPAPVFVDIVLRESMIRTASLAAGLRRALSPEVRNRIRFEMRREVKRARKQRRSDLKDARREWEAREREKVEV